MREKIKEIVDEYVSKNSSDYRAVCEYIVQKRKSLADSKFGIGENGYSAMYEIPEELHNLISKDISVEERQEFSKFEHKKWFANSFPQFRLPDEI